MVGVPCDIGNFTVLGVRCDVGICTVLGVRCDVGIFTVLGVRCDVGIFKLTARAQSINIVIIIVAGSPLGCAYRSSMRTSLVARQAIARYSNSFHTRSRT